MKISAPAIVARLVGVPCASLLLLWSANAAPAQRQVLGDHVPKTVAYFKLQPVDRLPGTNRLSFVIGLPFRNRPALTNLIYQLYDSRSPSFHRWLTPHQFNERFSPTREDYAAVAAFAKANGLTVAGTHPDRVMLNVQGSVADIERVFHITMRVYQHPLEKRTFFAPDVEPSLDLDVPVLHVTGLDNYVVPYPNIRRRPMAKAAHATPETGSGRGGSYIGSDFRNAYAPGVTLTGLGQVVGLFELDGYNISDITSYVTQAGQSGVTLQNVLLDGYDGSAGTANDEVCLDIEMTMAMAPGLSQITVYEAGNHSGYWLDVLGEMANPTHGEPLPNQLSSSWTHAGENATAEQYYQQFVAQGQNLFQASGDWGAYYVGLVGHQADSCYITVVGGTALTTDAYRNWYSETTWNDGFDSNSGHYWASGGGISQYYDIPSWQQGINMSLNQGSTTMRNVPDVAMTATGIFATYNNGSSTTNTGGTSAAAPLWSGFLALINEQAAANGEGSVGFINPAIYAIAGTSAFHDIADNSNNGNASNEYFACSGYDLCTGLGTPNGASLINALAEPSEYTYVNNNGLLTITGYNGAGGNVTIPGTINGRSVTSIGDRAFFQESSLTSVIIPSGVTNIGSMAFAQSSGLTSVAIPASVTSIGTQAFYQCSSLTAITVDASNAVYSSASGVLFDKARTTLIQCPGGKSGSYTVPATVTTIGNLAFSRCAGLTSVTIPANVTGIGTQAFYRCNGLTAITVNVSNTVYSSVSGILFDAGQTTLIQYPGGKSGTYTMPASITNIADWAFSACNNLTGIYFRGDAPGVGGTNLFVGDSATVYYLPGTAGWGSKFYGLKSLLWNPQVTGTNFGVSNKKFGFTIVGTSNIVVVVQACTNLTNPIWVPVGTNTLNGGSSAFTDAKWTNYPNRFYRSSFP